MKKNFNKPHTEDAQITTDSDPNTDGKLTLSIAGIEAEIPMPDDGWKKKKKGTWF